MTENTLQWIQILKLLSVVVFAGLYGFGGIRGKWKRRVLGAITITFAIVGFSLWMGTWTWLLLLCAPLYFGALSIGYGADELPQKIVKRFRAGLLAGLAGAPVVIAHKNWTVLGLHIGLCVITSIVLGAFNPLKSARAEETAIGFTYGFYPLMLI